MTTTATTTKCITELFQLMARHPEDIRVSHVEGNNALTYTVRANHADMPWLVGPRGAHISAVKAIFRHLSQEYGKEIKVILLEAQDGKYAGPFEPFRTNPKWEAEHGKRVAKLLEQVSGARVKSQHADGLTLLSVKGITSQDFAEALARAWMAIGKATGRLLEIEITS